MLNEMESFGLHTNHFRWVKMNTEPNSERIPVVLAALCCGNACLHQEQGSWMSVNTERWLTRGLLKKQEISL